jgi:hypothetical protein
MSDLSTYTDCLPLADAKKLLAVLQQPGKGGGWSDWSGEGGSENEHAIEEISCTAIEALALPGHCVSMSIYSIDFVPMSGRDVPAVLFPCGDDWFPPEYGDGAGVVFYLMPQGFKMPVSIGFSKRSGMRWFGRDYDKCYEIEISIGNRFDLITLEDIAGSTGEKVIFEDPKHLWQMLLLPDERSDGFIEAHHFDVSCRYCFDPQRLPEYNEMIRNVIRGAAKDSLFERCFVRGWVEIGGMASFEGAPTNVTPDALGLLALVSKLNVFQFYKIRYSYLGPRNWKDREKSRKKWKKPVYEGLGTATLENGAVATVSVAVEKEGYVFYLNFGSDDDLIKFAKSKLFQKTKWHSGAE